jgi:hypothetical protein
MNASKLLTISILFVLTLPIKAQRYADCVKAKEICKKGTHEFAAAKGQGKDQMEGFPAPCFAGGAEMNNNAEKNSTWIKVQIAQSGSFKFTIRPKRYGDDIDFVVYKLSGANCQTKKLVRCMAAGDKEDAVGSFCMGSTGLRDGESDISENPGCGGENNSFLKPLNVKEGEYYVILVSNVTSDNEGFAIRLFGTCMLPCDEEKKPKPEEKEIAEAKTTTAPASKIASPESEPKVEPKTEVKSIPKSTTPEPATETVAAQPVTIEGRKTIVNKTLSVKNRTINMKVWDSSVEDGDIISIYINGVKKYANIILTTKPQEFLLTLEAGENFITAHVESFGKREPNTAAISVNDGKKEQRLTLNATRNQEETMKIIVE